MKAAFMVVAVVLAGCHRAPLAASEKLSGDDSAVLTVAVSHFLAQPGSVFGPRGLVVEDAKTVVIEDNYDAATFNASFKSHHISVPQAALNEFIERNRVRQPVPVLGSVGATVQVEKDPEGVINLSQKLKTHVQTILSLRVPGYTPDRNMALVVFDFSWSYMHGGYAYYLLKRAPDHSWVVSASDMDVFL
jgi:hypothetical protein